MNKNSEQATEVNLQLQYEDCVQFVSDFLTFRRYLWSTLTTPVGLLENRVGERYRPGMTYGDMVVLLLENDGPEWDLRKKFIQVINKTDVYSDTRHELSLLFEKQFPNYAYAEILTWCKALRRQRREDERLIPLAKAIAYIGAALGFLLNVTPKAVVDRIGWDYQTYQLVAFWEVIALMFFVLVAILVIRFSEIRLYGSRRANNETITLLIYTLARRAASKRIKEKNTKRGSGSSRKGISERSRIKRTRS